MILSAMEKRIWIAKFLKKNAIVFLKHHYNHSENKQTVKLVGSYSRTNLCNVY